MWMIVKRFLLSSLCVAAAALICQGQSDTAAKSTKEQHAAHAQLAVVGTVHSKSELAQGFLDPIRCDDSGNLYLQTDFDPTSGIRKLNPKGERLALFVASSATDLPVWNKTFFSIAPEGDVYQLATVRKSVTRVILVYNKDGTYKSHISLNTDFIWYPHMVVPFASGDVLVAGTRDDPDPKIRVRQLFTAIFSSDGTLRKQIVLKDDKQIHDMATSGDPRVVEAGRPWSNSAIGLGQMEAAEDGNVYLMRGVSPAIIYAISPGGEVVKRFTVDPGDADYKPVGMHIAGRRIALLFGEFGRPHTRGVSIKVVDLDGHEIATYDEPKVPLKDLLGSALACYLAGPPERFVFLETDDNNFLEFKIAEPR